MAFIWQEQLGRVKITLFFKTCPHPFYPLRQATTGPHRLTVRTPGFHPGNRGSIPLGVTTKIPEFYVRVFLWLLSKRVSNPEVRAPRSRAQELVTSTATAYDRSESSP